LRTGKPLQKYCKKENIMSFEKKIASLEEIVEQIEDAQTPLDAAVSLYKNGIELARECGEILRGYEEEVQVLKKSADGFMSVPFEGKI
jgi:exodeoxyribonuclease VII small subunit